MINVSTEVATHYLSIIFITAILYLLGYWFIGIKMRTPPEIAADEQRKLERKARKMA